MFAQLKSAGNFVKSSFTDALMESNVSVTIVGELEIS